MTVVNVRWRPSGGRGEYEHVPADVLLHRRIAVAMPAPPHARIVTDVQGFMRAGKPRLRRDNPNDRAVLNIAPLVAALALLPDPRREDRGTLNLPLRDKNYVISSITFDVEHEGNDLAVCTPRRLQILHDAGTIDLSERFLRIQALLSRPDLGASAKLLAKSYLELVNAGISTDAIRQVADELLQWLDHDQAAAEFLEEPSGSFTVEATTPSLPAILGTLSADETKRRLVSHYKIDRDPKIRNGKVAQFKAENGAVFCENCGFSFEQHYGDRGRDFIEVHHKRALATLLPNEVTVLGDLMLLCSNCHRITHRKPPPLTPDQLKAISKYD